MSDRELDRQIGEKRGESGCAWDYSHGKPQCVPGLCVLGNCPSYQHLPYSSDLNITMRLVGDDWDINIFQSTPNTWTCNITVRGEWIVGHGATPALAMIDAITQAYLEVNGE